MLSIGKVSKLLGCSIATLRRWCKSGKIQAEYRTTGNHRRFSLEKIEKQFFHKESSDKTVVYSRVSSHDQKQDLITQTQKLTAYCSAQGIDNVETIEDLGSGLNYNKKGLGKLINLIINKKIKQLIINHKDRLLRFGSELIFKLCEFYQVKVIILEKQEKDFEQELACNVIEIMTVFCAKLYGKRSHQNKKAIQLTINT